MKSTKYWLMMICVLHISIINLYAFDNIHTLSSLDEYHRNYARWYTTCDGNGNEYFYGQRKDMNTKYNMSETSKTIFRLDTKRLEVSSIISPEQMKNFISEKVSVSGISVDSAGEKIAALLLFSQPNGGISGNILLIDVKIKDAGFILSDGMRNYSISLSPDGQYVAYYSSDPDLGVNGDKPINHSAGQILNINTKAVTTCTNHFVDNTYWEFSDPPKWIDNNHVLFSTISTDDSFINDHSMPGDNVARYSGIQYYPYVAVASKLTNDVKILSMAGGHLPPYYVIDKDKRRIYVAERSNKQKQIIVETDFNLENRNVVIERDPKETIKSMRIENGKLIYLYGENTYEIP